MTARTGIKLNPDILNSHIAERIFEDREVGGHRMVTCHLKMDNGFIVYGKKPSTSVDPANFDEELAKEISFKNTFDQLWELEAYRALVERDLLDKALLTAEVDMEKYIVKRGGIFLENNAEFSDTVQTQVISFQVGNHPVCSATFRAASYGHQEAVLERLNSEARTLVQDYIRSCLPPEEIHSPLVLRIAKVCCAAHTGMSNSPNGWDDISEDERNGVCEVVKSMLRQPIGLDDSLDNLDRVFKSIVDSFK